MATMDGMPVEAESCFLRLDHLRRLCAVEVAFPVRDDPVLVVEHGRDQERRVLSRLAADLDAVEVEYLLFLFKSKHHVSSFS